MVEVTIKLPEQIGRDLGEKPEDVARRLLEDAAIKGYREGRLSHRQVGAMVDLDYWQTESFLQTHQVPLNSRLADPDLDRAAPAELLGHR